MYEGARAKEAGCGFSLGRGAAGASRTQGRSRREMHGEPDRRLGGVGPLDAVAAVGRQGGRGRRPGASAARPRPRRGARPRLRAPPPTRPKSSSYQNPGWLACPVETMRSIRTAGDRTSVSTSSAADFPESPVRRDFPKPAWRLPRLPSRASRPIAQVVTTPTSNPISKPAASFCRRAADFSWAAELARGPAADGAGLEIAFAGRSNVGKSSLINGLTGRRTLARASHTPGRTQELNYFDCPAGLSSWTCRATATPPSEGQGPGLDPAGQRLSARPPEPPARLPPHRRPAWAGSPRPRSDGADGRSSRVLPGRAHQGRRVEARRARPPHRRDRVGASPSARRRSRTSAQPRAAPAPACRSCGPRLRSSWRSGESRAAERDPSPLAGEGRLGRRPSEEGGAGHRAPGRGRPAVHQPQGQGPRDPSGPAPAAEQTLSPLVG